jgi:hypothetical protein
VIASAHVFAQVPLDVLLTSNAASLAIKRAAAVLPEQGQCNSAARQGQRSGEWIAARTGLPAGHNAPGHIRAETRPSIPFGEAVSADRCCDGAV